MRISFRFTPPNQLMDIISVADPRAACPSFSHLPIGGVVWASPESRVAVLRPPDVRVHRKNRTMPSIWVREESNERGQRSGGPRGASSMDFFTISAAPTTDRTAWRCLPLDGRQRRYIASVYRFDIGADWLMGFRFYGYRPDQGPIKRIFYIGRCAIGQLAYCVTL